MQQTGQNNKITQFTDLRVWQQAHELTLFVYRTTHTFPPEEKYSLVDQMRRASLSITSNIAEGFGRQGQKEKVQFYFLAKGSLTELQNQLIFSRDIGYLTKGSFQKLFDHSVVVSKLLVGLIKAIKHHV